MYERVALAMLRGALKNEGKGGAVTGDEDARDYMALQALYGRWTEGQPQRFAVVAEGAVRGVHGAPAAARGVLLTLPDHVAHAYVVPLWPLEGWRHPRFVVESYRRRAAPPPVVPAVPGAAGPLMRDFVVAEHLRPELDAPDDLREPYLLIKDGALLGRYKRVTQVRQRVDAAMPPLAPVVFTSLRPARYGPFNLMILQALVELPGAHEHSEP